MSEVKIVGRGVDTLVLNDCYADTHFQPIKQEWDANLQEALSALQDQARLAESTLVTQWPSKGISIRGTLISCSRNCSGRRAFLICPFMI